MLKSGPLRVLGKVIEANPAGVVVEFTVSGRQTYKVSIKGAGKVGDKAAIEGELLSIVDTASPQGKALGFVSEVAHVKVQGVEFYCDPSILQAVGAPE